MSASSSSLSNLNDDVFCHALEYVNSYDTLTKMSFTNTRAHVWIQHSHAGARMEQRLYKSEYGSIYDSLSSMNSNMCRPYRALGAIKKKLLLDDRQDHQNTSTTTRTTLGILSNQDENDAIAYDHAFYFRENQQSIGYFGWKLLSHHNNAVVVWGDFEGIRILPSIHHLHQDKDSSSTTDIQKVGQSSSVLTVLVVPPSTDNNTNDDTLLFLGFASGKVSAVRCDYENSSYSTICETHQHTDEVTSLVLLEGGIVVSGGMDGKVYLYPDACAKKPSLSNHQELLSSTTPQISTKVLSMAATTLHNHIVLCIFGEPHVTILHKHQHEDTTWKNNTRLSNAVQQQQQAPVLSSEPKRATRVCMLKSDNNNNNTAVGIYGTNHGSLHKFELRLDDNENDTSTTVFRDNVITNAQAHSGEVDWMEVMGDVVFTSGGYEGQVQAWQVSDLQPLGTPIQAHAGRNFEAPPRAPKPQVPLTCSVVSIMPFHQEQSLMCLCRDGTMYRWKYGNEDSSSECVLGAPAALFQQNFFEEDSQEEEEMEDNNIGRERQPWTPERMDEFMETADAANQRRMQMRIIQAALHHGKVSAPLAAMFDRHADVPPCRECVTGGIGSYECRILQMHTSHLDLKKETRQLSHVMFTKLKRNRKFWVDRGDDWWNCRNCHADNKTGRCFVCMSWKGGVRGRTKKRSSGDDDGEDEFTAVAKKAAKISPDNDGEMVKVWECYVCFHRNPWKKYSCQSCGKHAGGRRLEVFQDEMEEDHFQSSVVSKSPKSHGGPYWQCATCNTDNPMTFMACSTCSSAPSKMSALEKLRAQQRAEEEANSAWSCRRCTFENDSSALSCTVCLKPRGRIS